MQRTFKLFLALGVLFSITALSGCRAIIGDESDSQVPHSQPASWEGQVPGMPTS